jgi:hypothetical protein
MAQQTGTLDIPSLQRNRDTTVAALGLDQVNAVLQTDLAAYNQNRQDMVSEMAEITTDRIEQAGGGSSTEMQEVDEYGRSATQKAKQGANLGYPLKLFQYAIGWTRSYFDQATPADLAEQYLAARSADVRNVITELKRAIFRATNYTFRDKRVAPSIDLPVKRWANADDFPIANGPNNEEYDAATHSHFTANATLTAGTFLTAINGVAEHSTSGMVRAAINIADETAVRALSGFVPLVDTRLTLDVTANQPTQRLDFTRMNNRPIGYLGPAEVWVKPWAYANYAFIWDAAGRKPIKFRERRAGSSTLRIAAELDAYPLHAQYMESEFGIGIRDRTRGGVFYFADTTYADPL